MAAQAKADPRLTALLQSEQGRAGVRLAELGVAALLGELQRTTVVAYPGRLLHPRHASRSA